jgi:hypothetical protein
MPAYRRIDYALLVEATPGGASLRLVRGSDAPVGVVEIRQDVLERAVAGRADDLRESLREVSELFPTSAVIADDAVERMTIRLDRRRWARIPWEAVAREVACVVRVTPVRPRFAQGPPQLPLRFLEVGTGESAAAGALRAVFGDSNRSNAVVNEFVGPKDLPAFVGKSRWPTIDLLHLRPARGGLDQLRKLQDLTERCRVRLLLLEAPATELADIRDLAQALVERSGPAVFLFDSSFTRWQELYGYLVHDRPLDWIRAVMREGELFGGAGREEALRYSPIVDVLQVSSLVRDLERSLSERRRFRGSVGAIVDVPVATAATPTRPVVDAVIHEAAQEVHLRIEGKSLPFHDALRASRFGATLSRRMTTRGFDVGDLSDLLEVGYAGRMSLSELSKGLAARARPLARLGRRGAKGALVARLERVGRVGAGLEFTHHESQGFLPLSAHVADAQVFAATTFGTGHRRSPPPRYVNLAFFDDSTDGGLRRIDQPRSRLKARKPVQLGIRIGAKDEATVTFGDTVLVEPPVRPKRGTMLEIGVTGIDFTVAGDPVQRVWLPSRGETDLVTFTVTPQAETTLPGVARLRVSIFRENNLVQSFLMAAALAGSENEPSRAMASALGVAESELPDQGTLGYLARLEYSSVSEISAARQVQPRALTIVANESAGQKVVTFKGDELFMVRVDLDLPTQVGALRNALRAASIDDAGRYRFSSDNTGAKERLIDRLWDVAREGWGLYSGIVYGKEERRRVRDLLEAGGGIHAAHTDVSSVIPWALVYDRPVFDTKVLTEDDGKTRPVTRAVCPASLPGGACEAGRKPCGADPSCLLHPRENDRRRASGEPLVCEETVICARRFWGFMFHIEVPAQQVTGIAGSPPPPPPVGIAANRPVKVVAGLNPKLSFTTSHLGELNTTLGKAGSLQSSTAGAGDVRKLLAGSEVDIAYFYCHAGTDARGLPVMEFETGDQLRAEDFDGEDWGHGALVFMNCCSSVAFTPYTPGKFVTQFIRGRKASVVIGTEVTIFETLAREMGTSFLSHLLSGKDAGTALLEARRALLAKGNPLGLVYTLYGSAGSKIST